MAKVQKITPFLWFDGNAEEAVKLYTSIFGNSKIGQVMRNGDNGPGPKAACWSWISSWKASNSTR